MQEVKDRGMCVHMCVYVRVRVFSVYVRECVYMQEKKEVSQVQHRERNTFSIQEDEVIMSNVF